MIEEDLAKLTNTDMEKIMQRCALVTLPFQNGPWDFDEEMVGPQEWLGPFDECNWKGITCELTSQTISAIKLPSVGANGAMPSEIGLLSALSKLDLGANSLTQERYPLHFFFSQILKFCFSRPTY